MDLRLGYFVEFCPAPLVLAVAIGLGAKRAQRLVFRLSLGALALLLASLALFAAAGFPSLYPTGAQQVSEQQGILAAVGYVLTYVGLSIQAGTGILGLNRSAQLGRWPWFGLILLFGLLIPFVWVVAASPASLLDGQSAQDLARTGLLFGIPYLLVGGILAVLMPLGTLLYGIMDPDKLQSR